MREIVPDRSLTVYRKAYSIGLNIDPRRPVEIVDPILRYSSAAIIGKAIHTLGEPEVLSRAEEFAISYDQSVTMSLSTVKIDRPTDRQGITNHNVRLVADPSGKASYMEGQNDLRTQLGLVPLDIDPVGAPAYVDFASIRGDSERADTVARHSLSRLPVVVAFSGMQVGFL